MFLSGHCGGFLSFKDLGMHGLFLVESVGRGEAEATSKTPIVLTVGESKVIGRGGEVKTRTVNGAVSSRHCTVTRLPKENPDNPDELPRWEIKDGAVTNGDWKPSSHGTYRYGNPIDSTILVQHGDSVMLLSRLEKPGQVQASARIEVIDPSIIKTDPGTSRIEEAAIAAHEQATENGKAIAQTKQQLTVVSQKLDQRLEKLDSLLDLVGDVGDKPVRYLRGGMTFAVLGLCGGVALAFVGFGWWVVSGGFGGVVKIQVEQHQKK
jgi:pSer/pThr/pTyr-binding forkhead associated (FHA) protein